MLKTVKYNKVSDKPCMTNLFLLRRLAAACLLFAPLPRALALDDGAVAAAAPVSGVIGITTKPSSYTPAWLQTAVQIRERFEAPSGTSLTNNSSDVYDASRIRVDLGIKPAPWLRFFVQAQDTRVGAYNTAPAPSTLYNPMDLRQGFVEFSFEGSVSMRLRAGRQEMAFGGERLIGPADWGMSRTFDAVDLSLTRGRARIDFLAGSAGQIDSTRFDRHKPGEHLYGVYGSLHRVLPGMDLEPYLLFKQNLLIKSETAMLGDAIVICPGARVIGKLRSGFDYAGEGIVQRGSYSNDRISARAVSGLFGWTVGSYAWKPRFSVEYNYASGDPATKDGSRNTFDQFYPSNHGYYGMIDQFGWKNLKNWRTGFDFVPVKRFKLRADFNEFYLATTQDSLYTSAGASAVLNRKATSGHIGSEINSVALYQWTDVWKFGAGLGHLYAGDYLKQSRFSFGYTYPYLMLVGTF